MSEAYIKTIRGSKNFYEIIKRRCTAYVLLSLIAQRARRTNETNFNDLELGEAYVGDYKTYGVTEQIYRTDKEFLEKYHFATFRGTSKGTIAKIVDTSIFDINAEETNERGNEKLTNNQRTTNEQLTTNKNVKNVKNVKNENKYLADSDFKKIAEQTGVDVVKVKYTYEKVLDYEKSSGRRYKDYAAATRNFIRMAQENGKLKRPALKPVGDDVIVGPRGKVFKL